MEVSHVLSPRGIHKIRLNQHGALKIRREQPQRWIVFMGHTSLNPTESDKSTPANSMMSMKDGTHEERDSNRGHHTVSLLPAGSMISMRRKAFTLVELLVVVAVIAILISLLLPAINRFRVQAQSTECLTNQPQFDCRVHPIFHRQERPGPGDRYRGIRLRLDANRRWAAQPSRRMLQWIPKRGGELGPRR